jgi:hypothetical protein
MACSAGDLQNSVSFRLDADNVNSAGTDRQTPGAAENEGDDKESLSFDASAAVAFACEESHPHPTYCYQTQRIFEMFCLDTLRVSMRSHVESVVCFKPEPTGSESSMSFMSMSSPAKGEEPEEELETHAQEVLGIVQRLREPGTACLLAFHPSGPCSSGSLHPVRRHLLGLRMQQLRMREKIGASKRTWNWRRPFVPAWPLRRVLASTWIPFRL